MKKYFLICLFTLCSGCLLAQKNGEIWNPDGIEMVFVEGSDSIEDFYIGKYEVTQAQWKVVMGNYGNPSIFEFRGDSMPVESVSRNDIQEFVTRLNKMTGGNYRLPSESEWEFAARGGTAENFCPGGCMYSGSNNLDSVAWHYRNSNDRTHTVGTKLSNELGIYDMTGNVFEWCQDSCLRGGSFYFGDENRYLISYSFCRNPDNEFRDSGFRLAHTLRQQRSAPHKKAEIWSPDGIEMVFVQGSGKIKDFYIGKYEITQAQWKAVMDNNPSRYKGDNLPVETVSWYDAQEFVNKLNAKTGRNYRLPSSDEWMFAARGGTAESFCHKGCKYSGSNNIYFVAWYGPNTLGSKPVGKKQSNELGIYDMTGNVWEWCRDCTGNTCSYRFALGGSWRFDKESILMSMQKHLHFYAPDYVYDDLGFRLACTPN